MASQDKKTDPLGMFNYHNIPLPEDAKARADVEHVLKHGYVILENVFTPQEAEEAKAEMRRLHGEKPLVGRNPFEGLDTNRVYSLLNKTRVFDKFAMLPRVLALNDFFLENGYMVSAFHTIQINPGENPQMLHFDDGYCHMPRPRMPLGTAIMLAFDEFTDANGATRVIPGSHLWGSSERPDRKDTIPAACPSGSAVYFIGTLWHGGGGNSTDKPRMSATVQYCQPYIRPIENQVLAVDPRRLKDIPQRIVDMMAYRVHSPFIGYADAMNPVKAAERMVRWLQKPLDERPPAFPVDTEEFSTTRAAEGEKSKL